MSSSDGVKDEDNKDHDQTTTSTESIEDTPETDNKKNKEEADQEDKHEPGKKNSNKTDKLPQSQTDDDDNGHDTKDQDHAVEDMDTTPPSDPNYQETASLTDQDDKKNEEGLTLTDQTDDNDNAPVEDMDTSSSSHVTSPTPSSDEDNTNHDNNIAETSSVPTSNVLELNYPDPGIKDDAETDSDTTSNGNEDGSKDPDDTTYERENQAKKKRGATGTGTGSKTTENRNEGGGDDGSGDDDRDLRRPWFARSKKITLPKLSRYSSYDTEQYRAGYPGKRDDNAINENFEFYTNRIPSYPNGDYIDRIHEHWWGQYRELEYNHSYIQWLFPIRERGMNWYAKELQLHEKEAIIKDKTAHERVLKSYRMMLDFYGLKLVDEKTGEVKRSENYEGRFDNLNFSGHNYLRITRILKCLGEFNYEHLKPPLIRRFLEEAITHRTLANALNSCMNYWIEVVKDESERKSLREYAQELVDEANKKIK